MKSALAAWMAALGLACSADAGAARLTSEWVRFPQVMITQQDGREVLTLRGVIHSDSFRVISKARQHPQRDGEINLEAHAGAMWFRRTGRSSSFVFHIPLNDSLRKITYGPERTPVWERDLPISTRQAGSWRAGPQSMEEVKYRLGHYESGLTRAVRSPSTSAMAKLPAPPDRPWTWLRSALVLWGRIDPPAAVSYLTAHTPAHEHDYFFPWIYLSYTLEQLQRWHDNEADPQLRNALASALSQRRLSLSPPPSALPPPDPAPR